MLKIMKKCTNLLKIAKLMSKSCINAILHTLVKVTQLTRPKKCLK